MNQATVGSYLAQRLEEVGVRDYFAIPGDFNLSLLDELLKNPRLKMINCCNELNAGYAADGYAREKGVAALVLTFGVGGLSAVNAVAGAFAEELPVIGFIGDGSFQMTAQEVSTILRYNYSGVIFLLNNGAYTIEVMIHDGPYNTLQNWNYAAMVESLKGQSPVLSQVVRTEKELVAAMKKSRTFKGLTFIEVILDRTDCNKALLGWGTAVADYNAGKGSGGK